MTDREQIVEVLAAWLCRKQGYHSGPLDMDREAAELALTAIENLIGVRLDAVEGLVEALRYLADRENWAGNPLSQEAWLLGHNTPYELARDTLDNPPAPTPREDEDE